MGLTDFLVNTDYPLDKVIYRYSGSASMTAYPTPGSNPTATIAHGLGFKPLARLMWSYSSTFDDVFMDYSGPTSSTFMIELNGWVESDGTNIYVTFNNFTSSSKTVYYKVFAYPTHDTLADVLPTNTVSGFLFSSDNNYMKLFDAGTIVLSSTNTVNHNLGYIPNILAWKENPSTGRVQSCLGDPFYNSEEYLKVDNDKFVFVNPGFVNYTIHYRIYLDEK